MKEVRARRPLADSTAVHDQVYDAIRQALITGKIAPGVGVSLRSLAAELGVSPMPVRDAVRRLVAERALAINPANDDTRHDYVKLLISLGELESAESALAPALAQIPRQLRFEALLHWLQALQFATTDERAQWTLDQFDAALAANKRDFDTRLAKSRLLMAAGQWEAAMEELLEIIMRDKKWDAEAPRKTFVAILEILTPPAPKAAADGSGKSAGGIELTGKSALQEDPQAALVASYRRKLSMALN